MEDRGRQVGHLGQSEFLALVEVGGAGQGKHHEGRRACSASPSRGRCAGSVPLLTSQASGSTPAGRASREACRGTSWLDSTQVSPPPASGRWWSSMDRWMMRCELVGVPGRLEQGEVEDLAELGGPGVQVGPVRWSDARSRPRAIRGGSYSSKTCAPGPVDRRGPRRGRRAGRCRPRAVARSRFGWLRSGSERSLASAWATSTRKPSTPRSAQNRRVSRKYWPDLGVVPVEVGLFPGEQVAVPLSVRRPGSQALPPKCERQSDGRLPPRGPAPSRKM